MVLYSKGSSVVCFIVGIAGPIHLLKQFFSISKKGKSNRRLLSQLDDTDQYILIGDKVSNRQENVTVNDVPGDQEFTVDNSGVN